MLKFEATKLLLFYKSPLVSLNDFHVFVFLKKHLTFFDPSGLLFPHISQTAKQNKYNKRRIFID